MPHKGGRRKKRRTHAEALAPEGAGNADGTIKDNIPRSIVARSTKVSPMIGELIQDVRKIMSPYTATNLRERSYNRTKDYSSIASQFGITHLLAFSETKNNIILRIARFHNGPTLHFRIPQYCLTKHVRAAQKRPFDSSAAFLTPPLIVLNNFGSDESEHLKLLRVTLQHMFPSINVNTVRLNECRRVILFHYKKETQVVEMRHYAIRATPVGINRNIKKILQTKIPNLGNLKDISEFLDSNAGYGGGAMSDSEAEDDPTTRVELSERFVGRGNGPTQQSAMKLIELGPRMNLELFKVENGMCEGDILYHKFESKSQEEILKTKERIESLKKIKEERRAQQEENVKKKRELQEKKRQEKEERKKRKLEERDDDEDDDEEESESENDDDNDDNDNDNEDLHYEGDIGEHEEGEEEEEEVEEAEGDSDENEEEEGGEGEDDEY